MALILEVRLTRITVDKVRRDNSNVYACDNGLGQLLHSVLRKERYQVMSEAQLSKYVNNCLAIHQGSDNPYPEIDFALDVQKYGDSLKPKWREVFVLFMRGYTPPEIGALIGRSPKTVYAKIKTLLEGFSDFYLKEE